MYTGHDINVSALFISLFMMEDWERWFCEKWKICFMLKMYQYWDETDLFRDRLNSFSLLLMLAQSVNIAPSPETTSSDAVRMQIKIGHIRDICFYRWIMAGNTMKERKREREESILK